VLVSEGQAKELKTGGLVIGGMPGARFQKDSCVIPPGGKLYVFSDGVYEITKADGTMMQLSELTDELARSVPEGGSKLNEVVQFAIQANRSDQFDDDFSMLEVTFV
jgi:sigma-B regulation protein RsbU (phosphoserine phosphatase)